MLMLCVVVRSLYVMFIVIVMKDFGMLYFVIFYIKLYKFFYKVLIFFVLFFVKGFFIEFFNLVLVVFENVN